MSVLILARFSAPCSNSWGPRLCQPTSAIAVDPDWHLYADSENEVSDNLQICTYKTFRRA